MESSLLAVRILVRMLCSDAVGTLLLRAFPPGTGVEAADGDCP